jgi:geranylgeranyl diphosphate synthase type I
LNRLEDFAVQGKMIRGGLVSLGYSILRPDSPEITAPLGAAVELFQSALLVHDDIMDRDASRRGNLSLYYQYKELAETENLSDPYHTGESLGICAGDIAFFLAFDMISRIPVNGDIRSAITGTCARELAYVGNAQMIDVWWGAGTKRPTDQEVLHLYEYKTGRYTFSLPLMVGAMAAEAGEKLLGELKRFGIVIGTIFQLKDDEIGLFGNEKEIGKPVGSDIREGKKTLHYLYLEKKLSPENKERLAAIYGNREARDEDVSWVRTLMTELGIREEVNRVMSDLTKEAEEILEGFPPAEDGAKAVLTRLLAESSKRKK